MSIYVGDKKAKLYHGDYGPAQLYKGDVKIAGYNNTEKVGTQISGVDTYNDALLPTIEGKSEQTVTANSPSPDYPSPIHSSENFDVVSCGRNVLDVYKWQNHNGVVPIDNVITQTFTSGALFLNNTRVQMKLTPNQTYSIVVNVLKSDMIGPIDNVRIWGYDAKGVEKRHGDAPAVVGSVAIAQFTAPPDGSYAIAFGGGQVTFTVALQIMILEGTYTAETLPPYEPYHATTAHVTEPLRSVGDVHDTIEVLDGKVELVKRVERFVNSASAKWEYSATYSGDGFNCWISRIYKALVLDQRLPTICSILKYVYQGPNLAQESVWGQEAPGNTDALLWIKLDATKFPDTASLLAKEFYIDYVPNLPPIRTDITATPLGQALLALRTQPHYTQVSTNATTPPTLRAKIKELL